MTEEEKQAKLAALRSIRATETQTQVYIQAAIDRLTNGETPTAESAKLEAIEIMKIDEVQRTAFRAALILGAKPDDAKKIAAELLPVKPAVVAEK
jgi:ubiquitin